MQVQPSDVLKAYQAAVLARDANAFLQLYAPDARVYDTWAVWAYDSTAARRPSVEGWFSSLGDERVRVTFDDVVVRSDTRLALLTATGRYEAVSAAGEPLRSMQNRFTWALMRSDDRWVIVHEHTSTPIGLNDQKAIFQREPNAPLR